MSISRREFVQLMGMAAAAGMLPGCDNKSSGVSGVTTSLGSNSLRLASV